MNVKVNWLHIKKGEEQGENIFSSKTQEFKSRNTRHLPEWKVGSALDYTYGFVGIEKTRESLFWR